MLASASAAFNFLSQNEYLLIALAIWTIPWKGIALWKSAHQEQKWWFIAFLFVNTLGILEMIYIFSISKKKDLLNRAFESS
jgi:hypothetical protein